jgi:undecaprenyl pyrophosphate phosphatase UppP
MLFCLLRGGFFVESYIDKLLNSEWVVAIALFLGGIALMYFDKWLKILHQIKI